MYLCKICFLFVVFQTCSANDDVLELSDSDFSARIAQHETALVMFYAPWCGHCKKLKPEFGKASRDLMRTVPSVSLLKIDCTVSGKETCNKYDVDGYPTLKIFRNGKFSQNYEGSREAGGIVNYMKAQATPISKELTSVAELKAFLKAEAKVCVVGFFAKELDLKNAFLQVAEARRETVRFAHSTSKQVLEKEGIADGIVLYRPAHLRSKFENDSVIYSGSAKTKEINDFITRNYHGLVGHRSLTNKDDFHNPLLVAYYAVDYVNNPKGTNYWRNRVLKVAKHYKDKVNFAISARDEFQSELQEYGPVDDDKPFVVARNAKNQKFVLQEPFTVEVLDRFVQDLLSNKLVPYLKTQPISESKQGVVKVAVAKNFQEVVVDNGKDTLVEFYAPWCGHCKKLASIYDNLGEKMKEEAVDIVKMDATANDVPAKYDVTGFPTLYWVPKGKKDKPVRYEGGRELNDFIKYIAEHATSELKGYDRSGTPRMGKTEL
jgi:protein disulfide isomerase family A protein 3